MLIAANSKTEARSLSAMLSDRNEFMGVGTATTFNELDATLHLRTDVDVLVTDVELGGATVFPIVEKAVTLRPNLNVLCYTNRSEPNFIMNAIRAGALGYVLRNSQESLDNCVRLIIGGGSPMSPAVTRHVLRAMQMKKNSEPLVAATNDAPDISTREREILELLAKGIPFAEIGTILMISPHTVTAHIKKIYRKLQVHSRGEAVYEARALNLISDSSRRAPYERRPACQMHADLLSFQSGKKPAQALSAVQRPDLPPSFSRRRMSVITMPRSTALHMS